MASQALRELAGLLEDEPLLAGHVDSSRAGDAPLGALAAAGPRTSSNPDAYALIVEAVWEGFLLHCGHSRLLAGVDPDLALLAGDHLYALGLDRLAALGDLESVRELSDLISLSAQANDGDRPAQQAARELRALWTAAATAVAAGPSPGHDAAKAALRAGSAGAVASLERAAAETASTSGIRHELERATQSIDFGSGHLFELG